MATQSNDQGTSENNPPLAAQTHPTISNPAQATSANRKFLPWFFETRSRKLFLFAVIIPGAGLAILIVIVSVAAMVSVHREQQEKEVRARELAQLMVRPSEVTEANFHSVCSNTDNCAGKFIIWTGIVEGDAPQGSASFHMKTFNGGTNAVTDGPLETGLKDGDQISFHGFIHNLSMFQDEIDKVHVRGVIATAKQIQEEKEKDEQLKLAQEAAKMGVNVETYLLGKSKETDAFVSCEDAAVDGNEWGGSTDLLRGHSWRIEGRNIYIGSSAELKNAFNAERRVAFECSYNLDDGKSTVLSVQ